MSDTQQWRHGLSDFDYGIVNGAIQAGLSVLETADLLEFYTPLSNYSNVLFGLMNNQYYS